jgi:hypothetical protein
MRRKWPAQRPVASPSEKEKGHMRHQRRWQKNEKTMAKEYRQGRDIEPAWTKP